MKAVKGVDGKMHFVPLSATETLLLPSAVGSKAQNNFPAASVSIVNNQKGTLLLLNTLHYNYLYNN
jgi:hypothetical protein